MPKHKSWKPPIFKFKIRQSGHERGYIRMQRPKPVNDEEALTGYVEGKSASDIEERFARALDNLSTVEGYEFLPVIIAPPNVAGSIQLDFLVYSGGLWPIQIDGDYIHKSAEAKAHDLLQDALTDDYFRSQGRGAQPSKRIPGHKLETQSEADSVARELF